MLGRLTYIYLLTPLHTGGTTQEGNLLGIARESHTDFPYIPSSTIRGRLRSLVADYGKRSQLFGSELKPPSQTSLDESDATESEGDPSQSRDSKTNTGDDEYRNSLPESGKLTQGDIWIGDGSLLWLPVPSLSHGVIWVSCPLLLRRWLRFSPQRLESDASIPEPYSTNLKVKKAIYLKDAIVKAGDLKPGSESESEPDWKQFLPQHRAVDTVKGLLVLSDRHCATLIQMSLWRQVKVKLDEHKTVDGGFRYEEAIPPDTLMYFPWGITSQASRAEEQSESDFTELLAENTIIQIGGQESLGRGFVEQWLAKAGKKEETNDV